MFGRDSTQKKAQETPRKKTDLNSTAGSSLKLCSFLPLISSVQAGTQIFTKLFVSEEFFLFILAHSRTEVSSLIFHILQRSPSIFLIDKISRAVSLLKFLSMLHIFLISRYLQGCDSSHWFLFEPGL